MMSEVPSDIFKFRKQLVVWHRDYTLWLWFSGALSVLIAGLSAYVGDTHAEHPSAANSN